MCEVLSQEVQKEDRRATAMASKDPVAFAAFSGRVQQTAGPQKKAKEAKEEQAEGEGEKEEEEEESGCVKDACAWGGSVIGDI